MGESGGQSGRSGGPGLSAAAGHRLRDTDHPVLRDRAADGGKIPEQCAFDMG